MVDYSKWDKFASELSDEEEDAKGPMVHHVEEGGRVTIGPDGATIAAHSAQSESAVAEDANTITTVAVRILWVLYCLRLCHANALHRSE